MARRFINTLVHLKKITETLIYSRKVHNISKTYLALQDARTCIRDDMKTDDTRIQGQCHSLKMKGQIHASAP